MKYLLFNQQQNDKLYFLVQLFIGATKTTNLEDAVAAVALKLLPEEIAFLEEPYVPHPLSGLVIK